MKEPMSWRATTHRLPRRMPWPVLFLLAVLAVPSAAQETQAVRTQRSLERWAAGAAAKKIVAELDGVRPEGLAGRWSREILDAPRAHRSPQASRGLLEREYLEELEAILHRRLVRLHSSLEPEKKPEEGQPSFSADWLVDYVTGQFADEIRTASRANADRHFDPLFARARQSAVAAQLTSLELEARPGLEEVDAVAAADWSEEATTRLRDELVARMAKNTTLLEETAAKLEVQASELIADARSQYQEQRAALKLPVDATLRAANEISRALSAHVEEARLRLRMAEGSAYPLYDVFPSVTRGIESRARETELRRFEQFIGQYRRSVDPRELRSRIEGDLGRHRRFDESRRILARELAPVFAREMVDEYSEAISNRARRAGFRERLGRGVEGELSKTLEKRVETVLETPLRQVHRTIAERQAGELFPEVLSGRFTFSESQLLRRHLGELSITGFEECLKVPHLRDGGEALERGVLLESTTTIVVGRTTKLLEEGHRALKGQLDLVRDQEPRIERTLRTRGGERSPAQWEEHFVGEVEKQWQEEGHGKFWSTVTHPPENAATKYRPLFGYVRDEIKKNVRAHYEPARRKDASPEPTRRTRDTREKPTGSRDQPSPDPSQDEPGPSDGRVDTGPERGGGLNPWLPGGGTPSTSSSCLGGLLWLLTIGLLVASFFRVGRWRMVLSAAAWVLASAILFLSFWTLGRRSVDVGDLKQASAELAEILGHPPDSVDSEEAVFKLSPVSRIVLHQAEDAEAGGPRPMEGPER